MKRLLFATFLLSIVSLSSKAQDDKNFYKKVYQFYKPSGALTECTLDGQAINDPVSQSFLIGNQFKIANEVTTDYIILFLPWKGNTEKNTRLVNKSTNKNIPEPIYFKISKNDFNSKCEEAFEKSSFALGILTLPIKMRFGAKSQDGSYYKRDFTFTGDVSFGFSAGWKYRYSRNTAVNILGGLAVSSIGVSPSTTNKIIATETNVSAITWHAGVLYEIDNFQIGGFTGVDYLAGEVGRNWMYRNSPWFGVGIGYSFLKAKKTSGDQDK